RAAAPAQYPRQLRRHAYHGRRSLYCLQARSRGRARRGHRRERAQVPEGLYRPLCGICGKICRPARFCRRLIGTTAMSIRPVKRVSQSKPTLEGAGVRLRRAFGFGDTAETDPFLLLDDFRNDRPQDYLAGFPWHPHRGIETITYTLAGTVEHGDSLGNRGTLRAGDVQWMTAGRGIMHQEMPQGDAQGRMHGFQLWANLPSSLKMTAPRYQDVEAAAIPEV